MEYLRVLVLAVALTALAYAAGCGLAHAATIDPEGNPVRCVLKQFETVPGACHVPTNKGCIVSLRCRP